MNRRSVLAALAVVSAAAALPSAASAQAQQDFALVNRTGFTINEIYVSAANQRNWGRDLLGADTLATGRTFNVRFSPNTRACDWDIRVVYADGDQSEFRGVNLCSVSRVSLFWDRARNQTRFVTE